MVPASIRFAAATHVGVRRNHNEDAYLVAPELQFGMVADGMGGHEAGEVASQLACEHVRSAIATGQSLTEAMHAAHAAIVSSAVTSGQSLAMGATVVAARVDTETFEIAWVGDSRAYLFDGKLHRLTRDHSYVEDLLQQGVISAEQVRTHPQRNVVTQALGVADPSGLRVGREQARWVPGMQLLLCSDGLTEVVPDEDIQRLLQSPDGTLQARVDGLVEAALLGGGPDNISVVVIELVPGRD